MKGEDMALAIGAPNLREDKTSCSQSEQRL